jgi:Carbohydrate-selective porin, OprB family/S-layer homology domain
MHLTALYLDSRLLLMKLLASFISPVVFCLFLVLDVTNSADATEPQRRLDAVSLEIIAEPSESFIRVVDLKLTDVKPSDWAYQAVQSLMQQQGVFGYPNQTFQGDRQLTRAEFAAALSKILPMLDFSRFATQEDLDTTRKLLEEFKVELENAEVELDRLQRSINQFSTTTKLEGKAIFALTSVGDSRKAESGEATDSNVTLGQRISLELTTSFTGKDILQTTLKTGNIQSLGKATNTEMARLSFQTDEGSIFILDELSYRAKLGRNLNINAVALGGSLNKFAETFNPFAGSSGEGGISRFGQRNPIYRQGGGSGLGVSYDVSKSITLSAGYLAENANQTQSGLFNGSYAAIAQLTFDLGKSAGFGVNYVRSYNGLDTATGSERANDPFRNLSNAVISNSWGLQGATGIGKKFAVSGWLGLTQAQAQDLPQRPTATIFNWALTLSFPDLGKEGNLGGIVLGQPPRVTQNDFIFRRQNYLDRDTGFHLEAFYRHKINDFLSVTPGVLILFNPEHNRVNDTLYIGTIRTTFSF